MAAIHLELAGLAVGVFAILICCIYHRGHRRPIHYHPQRHHHDDTH